MGPIDYQTISEKFMQVRPDDCAAFNKAATNSEVENALENVARRIGMATTGVLNATFTASATADRVFGQSPSSGAAKVPESPNSSMDKIWLALANLDDTVMLVNQTIARFSNL